MKKHTNKFFILIFSVVCVAVCVLFANLLSSAITVSGSAKTPSTYSPFTVYAISLGQYTSKSSAEAICSDVKKKGGAGYVFKEDSLFHVLASAYEKENDAKLVQENLIESGIDSTIVKMEIGDASFENVSSSSQMKEFKSALSALKTAFLSLYDISVSLDTSATDETKAKISIIEVKSDLEKNVNSISKGNSSVDGIYYQMIKNTFDETEEILIELKDYENINGITLSSKIKYVYIEVLEKLDDLIKSINNEI